jgi:hypothetical protein
MSSMMNQIFIRKKKRKWHKGIELGTLQTQIFAKKNLVEFLDNKKRLGESDNENLDDSLSTFECACWLKLEF